jgi:O-antigen ligase
MSGLDVTRRPWGLMACVLAGCPLAGYMAVYHTGLALVVAILGAMILLAPASRWLRIKVVRPRSAPPAPELLALPLLIEARLFLGTNVTIALLGCLLGYLAITKSVRARPNAVVVAAVAIVFALPFSRLPVGIGLTDAAIPALCIAVLFMSSRRRDLHTAISSLIDGVALYLIVNVLAYFAGVVSPAAAGRIGGLESATGGIRVIFPIAGSLATPAAVAAMYVAAAAICFERCSPARLLFRVSGLLAAVFILIAADTRAALVAAGAVFVLTIVSTRLLSRVALLVVTVSIAFSFVFDAVKGTVLAVMSPVLETIPQLSRGDVSGDLTLNFRSVIWNLSMQFWGTEVGAAHQWFGFGVRGQEQSGASGVYARGLGGVSSTPLSTSVHNSYMQHLFDAGIVGVLVLVVLLIWVTRRYAVLLRVGAPGAQLALPVLLAAVITGITEVTVSPGYAQAPVLIVIGLMLFATGPASRSPESSVAHDAQRPKSPATSAVDA